MAGYRSYLRTGVAAVALIASTNVAYSFSLEDAVNIAVDTHPSVRAAHSAFLASTGDAEAVEASFQPQVTLDSGAAWVRGNTSATRARHSNGAIGVKSGWAENVQYDSTLALSQTLWDAGRLENTHVAALETSESLRHSSFSIQQDVALRAVNAYIEVYKNRALVKLLEDNIALHNQYRELSVQQAESGAGSEADVEQIDTRLNLVQTRLTTQNQLLRDAITLYVEAVGEMPGELGQPKMPGELGGLDVEELVVLAFEEHPLVHASLATTRARRSTLEAAVPGYMPTLTMNLSAARDIDSGEFRPSDTDAGDEKMVYTAEVRMNLALYDGGAAVSARRKAMNGVEEATQREAESRRNIEQQVRIAHSAMLSAQEQTPLFLDALSSAETNVGNTEAQFDNGERTILEVLDVRSLKFDAEFNLVNAQYAEVTAKYGVLAAIGRLLDYAGVRWQPTESD